MLERSIALVGLACRYPDADSPQSLWENVLSQRRAFRRIPRERLRLADYLADALARDYPADSIYSTQAAVLADYQFDRVRFRVSGKSFRSADLAHWLALDVAAEALADAGFAEAQGLARSETGVLVGNTLTGEFSRANLLRLRWPYVRRQTAAALAEEGWAADQIHSFLTRLEARYKEPFPENTEESLAGGLANTIAGRIANHFDLHGGGYTVDGACASSILAVVQACSALASGDLEVALAGGVDLSLDPFELVGFARTGALARGDMRIFDRRPTGFIPGEGCGFAVLMRAADALAQGKRIYAVIRGWGLSSDGSGGLTRPEVHGQVLALRRAYQRAGFSPATVALFEGHGTGTAVGDAAELKTLNLVRREAGAQERAALGSIKGNFGHTKAAAGIAGLIKASLAIHYQILPPITGCVEPHAELSGETSTLRILRGAELWPANAPLRSAVSAMGFGGINGHVVLEGTTQLRRQQFVAVERQLLATPQDSELFLFSAPDPLALRDQVDRVAARASGLARAELTDLAHQLMRELAGPALPWRAALLAQQPQELADQLGRLRTWLSADAPTARLDLDAGIFLGQGSSPGSSPGSASPPRIGLLFPGQGSPSHLDGGLWRRRFPAVAALYERAPWSTASQGVDTEVAQQAIITASLAGLELLARLGVRAEVAVGHSLGEIAALAWAGAVDADTLRHIASARGQAMAALGDAGGAMASLGAGSDAAGELIAGVAPDELWITGYNGPHQTAIAGKAAAVEAAVRQAHDRGWSATLLAVSRAFHSPLVAAAAPQLAATLANVSWAPLAGRIASTITGTWLTADHDLRQLLEHQVTLPVRFSEAFTLADPEVDLWLEVGPGQTLSGLARHLSARPVIALDAGGPQLGGLLRAVAALFALGTPLALTALTDDRFARAFDLDHPPSFLVNPCELAPVDDRGCVDQGLEAHSQPSQKVPADSWEAPSQQVEAVWDHDPEAVPAAPAPAMAAALTASPLETVRQLLARRTELPPAAIAEDSRLLSDLHLNSIAVSELVIEAARQLQLEPPVAPTEYANATVNELAQALTQLQATAQPDLAAQLRVPPGVASWVRPFHVRWEARPLPRRPQPLAVTAWQIFAPDDHPLRPALAAAFQETAGPPDQAAAVDRAAVRGTAVLLAAGGGEAHPELLLAAAQAAVAERRGPFLLVEPSAGRGGGAAFARTLKHENPDLPVTIVALPELPAAELNLWAERIAAEVRTARTYSEVRFDVLGQRWVPVWQAINGSAELEGGAEAVAPPWTAGDLVVVSGGGKGIGAECALALAERWGVRLALLGRSRPEDDRELAQNLERLTQAGVTYRYFCADVLDPAALASAVGNAAAEFGPVRGILHSAGTNTPQLIPALEIQALERTLAPKVHGLRNLLAAVPPEQLKAVVAFGSIIGRMGLRGEADYALANEVLRRTVEDFAAAYPACRALCLEWSVWSGVGMGARLADLELLTRQGITPIPPDQGVAQLLDLLCRRTDPAVIVAGRFGEPPTVQLARQELPLRRFLEHPRYFVPGVELVVDSTLSADTDFYLADHVYGGERLFPAVLGLEGMVEVGLVLLGRSSASELELHNIQFARPVTVPAGETVILRLAALKQPSGEVDVVLRSSRTNFQSDHFRASVWVAGPACESRESSAAGPERSPLLPIAPTDLYGPVLFQAGRFQRLRGYRRLRATECLAEIAAADHPPWFASVLPSEFELGDPGARDASIHAVQACIPHATVLPLAVRRLVFGAGFPAAATGSRSVWACERSRQGQTLIYDLEIRLENGELLERWEELALRAVDLRPLPRQLAAPLWAPYLERRLRDLLPGTDLRVALVQDPATDRAGRARRAVGEALGHPAELIHRPDGKPEIVHSRAVNAQNGQAVSLAHSGDLVLAVTGHGNFGCDLEPVQKRSLATWQDLLGERRELLPELLRHRREDPDALATQVWTLSESLKKAGEPLDAPLVFQEQTGDGWLLFSAGRYRAATLLLIPGVERASQPIAIAVVAAATESN